MNEQLTLKPLEKKILSDFELLSLSYVPMQVLLAKIIESLMLRMNGLSLQPSLLKN